jgi:hypothetical protein
MSVCAFVHREPLPHHLLRDLRLCHVELVLDVHRREIEVAREVEIHLQVHRAVAGVRRLEVQQAVHPRKLLLDWRRDGRRNVFRGCTGVDGRDLDRGRGNCGIAIDRQGPEGERSQQNDHHRDHAREDGPPDEEVADLGGFGHGFGLTRAVSRIGGAADGGATNTLSLFFSVRVESSSGR